MRTLRTKVSPLKHTDRLILALVPRGGLVLHACVASFTFLPPDMLGGALLLGIGLRAGAVLRNGGSAYYSLLLPPRHSGLLATLAYLCQLTSSDSDTLIPFPSCAGGLGLLELLRRMRSFFRCCCIIVLRIAGMRCSTLSPSLDPVVIREEGRDRRTV